MTSEALILFDKCFSHEGYGHTKWYKAIRPVLVAQQAARDVVPGLMHCAKCKFQLVRTNLYFSNGTTGPGDNKTEPCPNGCGPLWPVTWKEDALDSRKKLDELFDENQALKKSLSALTEEPKVDTITLTRAEFEGLYYNIEQMLKAIREHPAMRGRDYVGLGIFHLFDAKEILSRHGEKSQLKLPTMQEAHVIVPRAVFEKMGRNIGVAANHLGLVLPTGHPYHDVSYEDGLDIIGAGKDFEIWAAWKLCYENYNVFCDIIKPAKATGR